jgi:hypothetical protein
MENEGCEIMQSTESGRCQVDIEDRLMECSENSASRFVQNEAKRKPYVQSALESQRNQLIYMIELEYGLLDTLCCMDLLTEQQIDVIQSQPIVSSQVSTMLDYVIQLPCDKQEEFLVALENSQQSHVATYIRSDGVRPDENSQCWPIKFTDEGQRMFRCKRNFCDQVDSGNGLLDELLSRDCISDRHKETIEAAKTEYKKNTHLLNIMCHRSVAEFYKFIDCLLKTKQHTIASQLAPNSMTVSNPLSEDIKTRLKTHYASLVCIMDARNGLLHELFSADCITERQKMFIESAASEAQSNQRLLNIVRRSSESDFHKFVTSLDKTGQQHVSRILLEDGAVARVVTTNSSKTTDNVKQYETYIVQQFKLVNINSEDDRIKQLFSQINECVDELRSRGVELLATVTGHSVALFYFCTSLAGLQHLYELYANGLLKTTIERLFNILLKDYEHAQLHVEKVDWENANYLNCLQHMYYLMDLLQLSVIYQLAHRTHSAITKRESSGVEMILLPMELEEILVIKAAGHLFTVINKLIQYAQVYTVTTLCAVSAKWWRILTGRPRLKLALKRYFIEICRPFKCSPEQLTSLTVEPLDGDDDRTVTGVSEFNGKLYVTCSQSDSVYVYLSSPPFARCSDMRIQGMADPVDIVACNDTGQLYLADIRQCAIWRVNLLSDKQVDKFITTQWWPWSLSINSRFLLITPHDGAALFLYGEDGTQLKCIKLPDYMFATHAVETTHRTYIVSHDNRWIPVTEVRA